jgi:hypothetical protein
VGPATIRFVHVVPSKVQVSSLSVEPAPLPPNRRTVEPGTWALEDDVAPLVVVEPWLPELVLPVDPFELSTDVDPTLSELFVAVVVPACPDDVWPLSPLVVEPDELATPQEQGRKTPVAEQICVPVSPLVPAQAQCCVVPVTQVAFTGVDVLPPHEAKTAIPVERRAKTSFLRMKTPVDRKVGVGRRP